MTMPLGANMLPWLRGSELARLNRTLDYFLLLNQKRSQKASLLRRLASFIVRAPIRWRLNADFFSFPWEIWLARLSEQIVKRRSLITGRRLPVQRANVC
jgi:anaerobic magnesium-protoporphyrin IX monomethyl ester cyclase